MFKTKNIQSEFEKTHEFEKRKEEANRIRAKYPDRIPVIVEQTSKGCLPEIDKHKFLVPNDLSVSQFIYTIRKRINITPDQAIFIFVNNELPSTSMQMSQLYEIHKNLDGFLYFLYSGESVFGNDI
jgi:GABA(A) receptor-associated protein